ncbi:hypothetical protein SCG7086_BR_00090, partial [Chlamydiales bacterium SCGC AG-110-P3]
MRKSSLTKQTTAIIESVRGQSFSVEERADKAIELAALMLEDAEGRQTSAERRERRELSGMMDDPVGKTFTTDVTDQCFRSSSLIRVADQLVHVLNRLGVPQFFSASKRFGLRLLQLCGPTIGAVFVPLTKLMVRRSTRKVILPGEHGSLKRHMNFRRKQGVRVNLNHLGEAILGEDEAKRRLSIYLQDLERPEVEYISVKVSTICSQINLLAWDETLTVLSERLRLLYRAARDHMFQRQDGTVVPKFVNLDMEEYRDLQLTVDVFRRVLEEAEFHDLSAGIVLQSYLPDAHLIQQELTVWAMQRVSRGHAPIKIRIVKGANLAMEQVESAVHGWPQAPYDCKENVDANFKRMLHYGCEVEHARAAHIGVASHNLFDVAHALLLRVEKGVEEYVTFEMLEGMADHIRRVVHELSGGMLLYCPAAKKEEFQTAVAYLVRRLDENTAPQNFLRHVFGLTPESDAWHEQAARFRQACLDTCRVSSAPRRCQNRNKDDVDLDTNCAFDNVSDTDFALPHNRQWVEAILESWRNRSPDEVPVVINGKQLPFDDTSMAEGEDPSRPGVVLYRYRLADAKDVDQALTVSKDAEKRWRELDAEERSSILAEVARRMRAQRGDLMAAMVADTGKTVLEADSELSEAIDFVEYYRRSIEEWSLLPDVTFSAKGTVLVAPPWNFPCAIPIGGVVSALASGNCVIFKPAQEAVLVAWKLVNILWEGGVPAEVLHFLPCLDDPTANLLVQDPRVDLVILTGATSTAKHLLRTRPGLDLIAETGGKNSIVVTALADRDLAIKDIVQSAFGHSGQKCSACSLAILEAEVYDDPIFRRQLADAAKSLHVGSAWDPLTKINPLARPVENPLLRALTNLEDGEKWLLKPEQHPNIPQLWSPGIKLGVQPDGFTQQTELFGPVLGLIRANDLQHAVQIANSTDYGLTAGIHSLDEREQRYWLDKIEAGNLYVNRGITGAVVRRQPFGGCKGSSYGRGSKAGGPNYIMQMVTVEENHLPEHQEKVNESILDITTWLANQSFAADCMEKWQASIGSYTYYWKHYFSKRHDPTRLQGQDNFFQ